MRWNGIKAVYFDFDDTLGNREKYAYECARDILKQNTDIDDPLELETVLQDWMLWDEKGNGSKAHVQKMLMEKYGLLGDYDISANWDQVLWKYAVPFEDTKKTLTELQRHFLLGVITNGPSMGQHQKLVNSGLSKYFDEENVIVSGDYSFQKPDVRIFQKAMEISGMKPEECVYVGDIFANDITGSLKAGMHAVWMWNWGSRECGVDVPVIHHISELLELLL